MAEKGPESGKSNAAIGFAEATPESMRVKRKTDPMIQLDFFIANLLFLRFPVNFGNITFTCSLLTSFFYKLIQAFHFPRTAA
jgi:hypothetical protein